MHALVISIAHEPVLLSLHLTIPPSPPFVIRCGIVSN